MLFSKILMFMVIPKGAAHVILDFNPHYNKLPYPILRFDSIEIFDKKNEKNISPCGTELEAGALVKHGWNKAARKFHTPVNL